MVCVFDFRSPFQGDKDYVDIKTQVLQLGFEMATCAHRDIFSDQPNRTIRNICETLVKIADHIIQVFYSIIISCLVVCNGVFVLRKSRTR